MNSQLYRTPTAVPWKVVMILMILFVLALMWAPAAAQGQHGQAMEDSTHHPPYDVQTVETITGKIARIDQLPGRMEGRVGIHAMLETDMETVEVHLGPYLFLSEQSLQLKEGEGIEVTGSRIMHQGEPAILAKEVRKGNHVLTLRDEDGRPKWRGMMGGGKQKHKNHKDS